MIIGSTLRTLVTALLLVSVAGCASFATQRMADNLASAMLNQDDPDTVRAGAPAYLLLLDSLIEASPDDTDMLIAGANLYGAYASGLIEDPVRGKRLSSRALNYARKAMCGKEPRFCSLEHAPFDDFIPAVNTLDPAHIKSIYAYASSWAGWIRAHSDDWNAIADLPRVEMLLQWVVDSDSAHAKGRAQLYLGIMHSQLPPQLGGKPETGRLHFEQAIVYSSGRDLIIKVEYARSYARLVFDQALHDRLLQEVIAADPLVHDLTLSNTIAQRRAKELLADDFF
ncbi:MAG: TRAP transporter TatT component family protein [Candidatus Sedimenticola sp. (ex Thyasira tokunagai)]